MKTLLIVLALLWVPTLLGGFAALSSNKDQLPIVFGLWMFLGLVPAIGGLLLFNAAKRR